MEMAPKIDNLMKVTLDVWKGSSEDNIDQSELPVRIHFIYGIGTAGLTEMEYALVEKKVGDVVRVKVGPTDFHALFSHLACKFHDVVGLHLADAWLMMKIVQISQADNREIVKAMADAGSCGGGCDCGCGC